LGKAIASLANFEVDPPVPIHTGEIVLLNELHRNVLDLDADIFRVGHGSVEVENFRSMVLNRAPFLEMTLLRRSLTTSREAVLVPTSPGKQILVPLMVIRVWSGSSFSGQFFPDNHGMTDFLALVEGDVLIVDDEEGVGTPYPLT
jgi:hypothetical protein